MRYITNVERIGMMAERVAALRFPGVDLLAEFVKVAGTQGARFHRRWWRGGVPSCAIWHKERRMVIKSHDRQPHCTYQEDQKMLKNGKNYALACLILIFFISCSAVDQAKFENLDRAVKSIQGATMTGVNYARFGELLQNLATEILIAKDQIKNPKEKELIDQYSAVFEVYKDSYEVWGFQLKSLPSEKTMVRVIANKYDLVVNPDAIDHSRMVQELWQVASEVSATIHGGRDAQRRAEEAAALRKLAAAAVRQRAEAGFHVPARRL